MTSMTIEQLMVVPDETIQRNSNEIIAGLTEAARQEEVEQEVRRQLKENIAGQETSESTMQMLEQKYGLAPVKFTRIEEKVIRKQIRKEERIREAENAGA
jgi:hypothetical protein